MNDSGKVICQAISDATSNPVAKALGEFARATDALAVPRPGFEAATIAIIRGLGEYADAYRKRFESNIADDHVIGVYWLDALKGFRGMLRGDSGRVPAGALDSAVCALYNHAGFAGELE